MHRFLAGPSVAFSLAYLLGGGVALADEPGQISVGLAGYEGSVGLAARNTGKGTSTADSENVGGLASVGGRIKIQASTPIQSGASLTSFHLGIRASGGAGSGGAAGGVEGEGGAEFGWTSQHGEGLGIYGMGGFGMQGGSHRQIGTGSVRGAVGADAGFYHRSGGGLLMVGPAIELNGGAIVGEDRDVSANILKGARVRAFSPELALLTFEALADHLSGQNGHIKLETDIPLSPSTWIGAYLRNSFVTQRSAEKILPDEAKSQSDIQVGLRMTYSPAAPK